MKSSFPPILGYPAIAAALGMLTALVSGILVFTGLQDTLLEVAEPNLMMRLVPPMLLGGLVCGITGVVFTRALPKSGELDSAPAQLAVMKGAAFDGSSIPMLLIDQDYKIISVNESFITLLNGYLDTFRKFWPDVSPDTIIGECIDKFHRNPAHQHRLIADLSRMPFRTDISVGDCKFALSLNAVMDFDGNHVGSVLEWVDVSDARVNAGMIEAISQNQGVLELSLKGEILSSNQTLQKRLGYTAEEFQKRPVSFINPGRDERSGIASPKMWEGLRNGNGYCEKFLIEAKGGHRLWFNTMISPVCDQAKKPYKVVALMSDVTALEEMTFGQTAVMELDATGQILRANRPFLEVMGYSDAELAGKSDAIFLEAQDATGPAYRLLWKNLTEGQPQRGTFRRFSRDGRVVYLQGSYNPVRDQAGNIVRVSLIANDTTTAETERLQGIAHRERTEAEQAQVVKQFSASLSQLAEGDLTIRLHESFAPDYEILRSNFNDALATLEKVLATAFATSEAIRDKSVQVTQAADDLAHRTETQAAALEEAAASLEQLTASVRAAAENAEKANMDVDSTRKNAEESGRIVREAVDAMGEIEKSSNHISRIIGVIDDIAFQTNLLALNAGVEAARAGDAGRGFAVVASEVRALAQRSSDAAKEISALISTSSQQVGRGVDLVRKSGQSLETIVNSVAGITTLVKCIAHSAREQASGLTEINTSVTQLDQVTQQNAAMVEETTAASHAMKSDAETLERIVRQFKVNAEHMATLPQKPVASRKPTASRSATAVPKALQQHRSEGNTALAIRPSPALDDWTDF